MRNHSTRLLAVFMLILTPVLTYAAPSGIYKWVDADGNTHFGDKPEDSAQVKDVQPVELKSSYQPDARTPEEQEAFEKEQRSIQEKGKERLNMQQQERDEAQAKVHEENAARCTAYATDLEKLSSSKIVNGRRLTYYVEEEGGKSVTSERQREIVQEVKDKMAALGCP
jgi:hypothetical protein